MGRLNVGERERRNRREKVRGSGGERRGEREEVC